MFTPLRPQSSHSVIVGEGHTVLAEAPMKGTMSVVSPTLQGRGYKAQLPHKVDQCVRTWLKTLLPRCSRTDPPSPPKQSHFFTVGCGLLRFFG